MLIIFEKTDNPYATLRVTGKFTGVKDLKQHIAQSCFPDLGEDMYYLEYNGKVLSQDDLVQAVFDEDNGEAKTVNLIPRLCGGKGGFGSMLRAIGAQIEKTTNRDACRDLSGRRLRDINEEQRLKKWFQKQQEREQEKQEAKKRKLDRLRVVADGPPLPKIDDQDFLQQREDIVEGVHEAVDEAFKDGPQDVDAVLASKKDQSTSMTAGCSKAATKYAESDISTEVSSSQYSQESESDISPSSSMDCIPSEGFKGSNATITSQEGSYDDVSSKESCPIGSSETSLPGSSLRGNYSKKSNSIGTPEASQSSFITPGSHDPSQESVLNASEENSLVELSEGSVASSSYESTVIGSSVLAQAETRSNSIQSFDYVSTKGSSSNYYKKQAQNMKKCMFDEELDGLVTSGSSGEDSDAEPSRKVRKCNDV